MNRNTGRDKIAYIWIFPNLTKAESTLKIVVVFVVVLLIFLSQKKALNSSLGKCISVTPAANRCANHMVAATPNWDWVESSMRIWAVAAEANWMQCSTQTHTIPFKLVASMALIFFLTTTAFTELISALLLASVLSRSLSEVLSLHLDNNLCICCDFGGNSRWPIWRSQSYWRPLLHVVCGSSFARHHWRYSPPGYPSSWFGSFLWELLVVECWKF